MEKSKKEIDLIVSAKVKKLLIDAITKPYLEKSDLEHLKITIEKLIKNIESKKDKK